MKEELKKAYKRKEKAERLLSGLGKKGGDDYISNDQLETSKAEYSNVLDEANRSIKSLKNKLRKEFDSKADELESSKRELALLSSRFEINEITSKSYYAQANPLKKLVKKLEKDISDLNKLIHSSNSADLSASGFKVKHNADQKVSSSNNARRLSPGTLLVICIIAVITIFVVVSAVIKESNLHLSIAPPAATVNNTEDVPVMISSVNASEITDTEAVITWDTNKATRSQLEFGTTSALGVTTSLSEELKLKHNIHIGGLDPDTSYYYRARSVDAFGDEVLSGIYEIHTLMAQYDGQLFTISEINVYDVTDSTATISWLTDKEATGQIEYGLTADDSLLTPVNEELTTIHEVHLSGLQHSTTYYFRVKSKDSDGNEVISQSGNTFITLTPISDRSVEGKEAPDFTVFNLNGGKVALKDFSGKWLMITFWQAKCSACRGEMPQLQNYFESRTDDEPVILAMSVMEKESFVRAYVESEGLTFSVLLDPVAVVAGQYKIRSFPTTFLINADGVVVKELKQVFDSPEEIKDTVDSIISSYR